MRTTTVLLLVLAFSSFQAFAQDSTTFLEPLKDAINNEEEPEIHAPEPPVNATETPADAVAANNETNVTNSTNETAVAEVELTPEQEAFKHSFREIPNAPADFKRMPLSHIRTDPTIMRSYASAVPVYLLRAIAAHERFRKTENESERAAYLERGFFPPGPYLMDLVYIFKKKVEGGMVFVFGVTTHQCVEKSCKSHNYKCSYPSFFSAFEPNEGKQRAFLDFEVKMAPEGFMQCPNYKLKAKAN